MAKLTIVLGAVTEAAERKLNSFRGQTKQWASQVNRAAKGAFIGVMAGLVAGLGVAIRRAGQLAAKFEQTKAAFQVMIGNLRTTEDLLQKLTALSNATPFSPDKIINSARKLLSFGIAAREVTSEVSMLGDVSAGTGKDLEELAAIYGKAFTKGKADMEVLNQLSEAGVPIIQALADQYGKTGAEVIKMASSGKVSFEDLRGAMQAMTGDGGAFFEMMQRQSQTLNGQLSTLDGLIADIQRGLGEAMLPEIKSIVSELNKLASAIQEIAEARNKLTDRGGDVEVNGVALSDRLKAGAVRIGQRMVDNVPLPQALEDRMRRGIANVNQELQDSATTRLQIQAPSAEEIEQSRKTREDQRRNDENARRELQHRKDAERKALEDDLDFTIPSDLADALLESNKELEATANAAILRAKNVDADAERDKIEGFREQAKRVKERLNASVAGGGIIADDLARIGGARGVVIDPAAAAAQAANRELKQVNANIKASTDKLDGIQKEIKNLNMGNDEFAFPRS